jgi:NAD(P)-dependent dehydrogenase (short-subunit alcohol dehydrogenase family)
MVDVNRELVGKAALVSGGSQGIGRAIVRELAAGGADVAFGFLNSSNAAEALACEAGAFDVSLHPIRVDLADDDGPMVLVDQAVERLGRVDVLVVNAAIWHRATLLETVPEMFDAMQRVNVRAAYFLVQATARQMIARQIAGRIVIISSRSVFKPRAGSSAYALSKAAQHSLVQTAATELAPFGITVNEVAPGPTETEMNRALRDDPEALRGLVGSLLVKRLGRPEEVARAVRFLVSDDSSFMTGVSLNVDGGGAIA